MSKSFDYFMLEVNIVLNVLGMYVYRLEPVPNLISQYQYPISISSTLRLDGYVNLFYIQGN